MAEEYLSKKTLVCPARHISPRLYFVLVIFLYKVIFIHHEKNDAFNETDDRWDECPAKKQVYDAHPRFLQVKLMDAKTTKKDGQ